MASFWETMGPGLFETGLGLYTGKLEKDRAEKQLRRAQGPVFDQSQRLAGQTLSRAEGMDPKTMAAERFAAQQELLAPGNELAKQKLMRELQARGMLGAASFAPVPGTVAQPGVAMNPQLAALFAAQEGAKAKSAFDSLAEGEQQLDRLVNRGGALSRSAEASRAAGAAPAVQNLMKSRPSIQETLLRGFGGAMKDKGTRDVIFGGLKKIPGLFSGMFGGSNEMPYLGEADTWGF